MKILKLPFWDFFKSIDEFPQYFDKTTYWLSFIVFFLLIIAAVILLGLIIKGIYSMVDSVKSYNEPSSGVLIDKRYSGEQSFSGTGTAIMPNSSGGIGVGIVSTSSHKSEEFLFFVEDTIVHKINTDMQLFYRYKIGDRISFTKTIGGLSKRILEYTIN